MVNKTISIPEEINNKLKCELNSSKLISDLLRDYYDNNYKDTDTLIENVAKEIKVESEKEKQAREKEEKFKSLFFKNFRDISGKDATEEFYQEFNKLWLEGKGNIWEFIWSKYPELEPKEETDAKQTIC